MSLFIQDAYAAAQATPVNDSYYSLFMIAIIFLLFYFMIIRPQNQRAKAQRTLLESLKKGDEIITNGGVVGKIASLDEQYLKLLVADACEIVVQRAAVQTILPKGTLKTLSH